MVAGKKAVEEEEGYKMEIRVLEQNKDGMKLALLIKESSPSFMNTLRRTIMEEVPTMAIEEVEIQKNNSILYDEMIAHRLGLVPLTTDLKGYELPPQYDNTAELSAKHYCTLVLSTKGPCTVYASDLKSKDPAVKPVYPKMPIVKLLKGQSLELEAKAMLGTGSIHAKWVPGLAHYKYKPVIEIGNVEHPEKIVEAMHGNVFEIKNGKLDIIKENLFKYDFAGVLEDASDGKVKLKRDNDFIFTLESWGQLSCKEIFNAAFDTMNEAYDKLAEEIKASEK